MNTLSYQSQSAGWVGVYLLQYTYFPCKNRGGKYMMSICDVTEAVTLSDRYREVTVSRYIRGFAGNKR
jgi:hypothetical protein